MRYPQQIIFYACCFVFCSCAGILNSPVQKIRMESSRGIDSIKIENEGAWKFGSNEYYVRRSPAPLKIYYKIDSLIKHDTIKAGSSLMYIAGNIYFNYGLGILIDRNNPKRYAYPKSIYLDTAAGHKNNKRWPPVNKENNNLIFSIPYINFFSNTGGAKFRTEGGFFGIAAGMDKYYSNNKFLSFGAGVSINAPLPFPIAVEHFGDYTLYNVNDIYFNLRNNHQAGALSVGYGVNVSRFQWDFLQQKDSVSIHESYKNTGLGLSLDAQYRFGKYFYTTLLYQPSFIWFKNTAPKGLQQFISLELLVKIPLKRKV